MITCEKEPLKGYIVKKITGVHLLFFYSMGCMILYDMIFVVYFDQRTGLLVKINFFDAKQLFRSLAEQSREKRKESHTKTCNKRGVYQFLTQ